MNRSQRSYTKIAKICALANPGDATNMTVASPHQLL